MTKDNELLSRITVRADVFGGKPIIRDMRIAVEHILAMLAAGDTPETILREYEILEPEDILACLVYAHRSVGGETVYQQIPSYRFVQKGYDGGGQSFSGQVE